MNTKKLTLTIREIFDLAKAVQLIPHKAKLSDSQLSDEDAETEYTVFENEKGVSIEDDDKTVRIYKHGAYLTEYPEEGTFPLGEEAICPKCGSEEIAKRHIDSPPAHTETDWKQCDACGHQWDHQ